MASAGGMHRRCVAVHADRATIAHNQNETKEVQGMVEGVALEGAAVVIRGSINPMILTPQWLLDQDVIGRTDFDNQDVEVISRELVSYTLGWLKVVATLDSLQFSTAEPEEFLRLRDVAIRVLELLRHTPVAALGINRDFHSHAESPERFHAIGDALTPKGFWEGQLVLPGMRDVTVQGVRPDLYAGHVQVAVQPSVRIPRGVFVLHNDHFDLTRLENQPVDRSNAWDLQTVAEPSAEKNQVAVEVLRDRFEDSLARAERIHAAVMAIPEPGIR